MSYILENIPSIHASIIGVLAAFYSAYFFYAHQKIAEAQKSLEKEIKFAEGVATPSSFIYGEYTFTDINGKLDWDNQGKMLFLEAISIFASKYSQDASFRKDNEKQITETVQKLLAFFSLFFTKYPLIGKEPFDHSKLSLLDKTSFDNERYAEIQRRIIFLSDLWENNQESLISLFNSFDQIKEEENERKLQDKINEKNDEIDEKFNKPGVTPQFIKKMKEDCTDKIKSHHQPTSENKSLPLLFDYFQRVQTFEDRIFPAIDKSLKELETFNDEFKVNFFTKKAIFITLFILTIGIILPLILTTVLPDLDSLDKCHIKYIIDFGFLFFSFSPYYYLCVYFLNKISNTFSV